MNTRPTLYTQLQRYILPRLLAALGVVGVILCLCIFYVARDQISTGQREDIEHLKRDINIALNNTTQLMEGIAANDLLINSIIDSQQRENYLPVFFHSLRFTPATEFSLGLFEFDGEPLITHNWDNQIPDELEDIWKPKVLEQSESFSLITESGILNATPVLIAGESEGALVNFTPSFQALIYERDIPAYLLITNSQNKILYSNHLREFQVGSIYDAGKYRHWVSESTQWQGLTLISQAPALAAYSNVLWLIPAILLTLCMAIIVSFYASNRAARLSASTLRYLHDDVRDGIARRSPAHEAGPVEASELNEIRAAFNELISNITSISLSNKQFSNVIDSLEEILVVLDENNEVMLSNRAYSQYQLYYQLETEHLLHVREVLNGKQKFLLSDYASLSEGAPVTINWTALPLFEDNHNQASTILVGNDVTQQRVLEKRIHVISHAIKAATVPILIADAKKPGYPAIYANPHLSQMTGFNEVEVINQSGLLLRKLKVEQGHVDRILTALGKGTPCNETLQCALRNQTQVYLQIIITPVFTEKELTHFVGFFQDVTEREQAQQFLEQARQRAEESARLKSGFLASMSHEVRTPLHGVAGALQLVSKTRLSKPQQHYVDLADESIRNLQHIVDDILDFSKIEAGQMKLESVPFNLQLLVETLYEQFSITSNEKGVTLRLETTLHDHTMVVGDPVRIRQVLSNLLSNAVKFTPSGSIVIYLTLQESERNAWVISGAVEDSGIGIDASNLDSIFEVFSQEDISTTRRFGGTGLGLSISRQLCRLMGGDLTVTSEKGRGSRFSFTFAAGIADTSVTDSTQQEQPEQTGLVPDIPQPAMKILIVEDNEINQLIAREHLSGHKTLTAKNGVEALSALNRVKLQFDLILMDCHMPQMDGFETTRRIRSGEAGERYRDVPIIALTANAMKGDRERCEAAGMDDYISKPFTAETLMSKVLCHASFARPMD